MLKRIDQAPCGIITITPQGNIQYMNRTFAELLQIDQESVIGLHIETFMTVSNRLLFHTYFYPYITMYGVVEELLLSFRAEDGTSVPVSMSGKMHRLENEVIIDCTCISMKKRFNYEQELRDIRVQLEDTLKEKNRAYEELKVLNEEVQRLARTDELTGLANRRYANQWMDTQLASLHVADDFGVIILDIDHFKQINDAYGHAIGDLVLKTMAQTLEEITPEDALVGRYGGEEFIVILPRTSAEVTRQVGETLRYAVHAMKPVPKAITISLGSAQLTAIDSRDSLLTRADRALYYAKVSGRDRFVMDHEVPQTFELKG